ncbi:T9SS type A sorting domain-containing protein [Flavobacterium sp.]|uniref:DUF7619 domain-containing protein n=1 Tax=Flavobacterium sp. TaxID=239 RepID=UPI0039E2AF8D
MKKLYTLVVAFVGMMGYGQVINFTDYNFKDMLLYSSETHLIAYNLDGQPTVVDTNANNEIEVSEAQNIKELDLFMWGQGVHDLGGIEYFTNLESINMQINQHIQTINFSTLTHFKHLIADGANLSGVLDFSNCPDLRTVYCPNNHLTGINLTGVNFLEVLDVSGSNLTSLEVHSHGAETATGYLSLQCSGNQLTSLLIEGRFSEINCADNQLTHIDISNCEDSSSCYFTGNPLVSMNIKNGFHNYMIYPGDFPLLEYLCCDAGYEYDELVESAGWSGSTAEINTYCTVEPQGNHFTLQGTVRVDANSNGCDASDEAYPHLRFTADPSMNVPYHFIANESGNYTMWFTAETYTITPNIQNPSYFTVSPPNLNITFAAQTTPVIQDFCITPNGSHDDLSVSIVPLNVARPGFDARYNIVYRNVGTTTQSGSLAFSFDDAVMDLVDATPAVSSQSTGQLHWNFANLAPFESRTILVRVNLNSPVETPSLNSGDVLNYTATLSANTDETPADNSATVAQGVVNSFDPNDKNCLEGTVISPEMIGGYVHYLIRFENTGTFAAENIFVKDMIDTDKFDIESLVALEGSHPYVTRIDGNKVEFVFQNINLPFDDAHNDGYVLFKIKPKNTLVLGDSFSNTASIYFDFNHPIVTEPAVTLIAALGKKDFEFSEQFSIYPNPAGNTLHIQSKNQTALQSLRIYNYLGQLVMSVWNPQPLQPIDVSALPVGSYFLRIDSSRGQSNTQFIKK